MKCIKPKMMWPPPKYVPISVSLSKQGKILWLASGSPTISSFILKSRTHPITLLMGTLCPWGKRGGMCKRNVGKHLTYLLIKQSNNDNNEVWSTLLWFCFSDRRPDTQGCAGLKMIPRCLAVVHQSHGLHRPAGEKCSSPHWTQPATQVDRKTSQESRQPNRC